MVFDVAIAGYELGNVIVAELGKDDTEGLLQKIRQDIEPAAMSHAHANFFNSRAGTFVQNRVENHHQRFCAL